MVTRLRAPEHRSKVPCRCGLWLASCSRDWPEGIVSEFSGFMAIRRHQGVEREMAIHDGVRQAQL